MTPLSNSQKESILRRISFALLELKDLEPLKSLGYKIYSTDRKTRRNIERLIENLANASIDIAKILLASEDIELPATYQETILKLSEVGVIEEKLAQNLSELVRARNVLAHQYLDIRWAIIDRFLKDGSNQFKEFLQIVEEKTTK